MIGVSAARFHVSTLNGSFWTSQSQEDLRVRIWGAYTGPPGTGVQQFYYTCVDTRLQVGADSAAAFHQGIRLVNTPEAAGP